MRHKRWFVFFAVSSAIGCGNVEPGEPTLRPTEADSSDAFRVLPRFWDGHLVVFRAGTSVEEVHARISSAGGRTSSVLPELGVAVARGTAEFAANIAADAEVVSVGREGITLAPELYDPVEMTGAAGELAPGDDLEPLQWGLRRVRASAAAHVSGAAQRATAVAVLDSGVMDDHPDLAGRLVASVATNLCLESGGPNDTEAYPVYSYRIDLDDFDPESPCSPVTPAFNAHGTHVAGIVGASRGGGRVVGVAPEVGIAAYKVFDRVRYTRADGVVVERLGALDGAVVRALTDAADRGIDVANLSLGALLDRSNPHHEAFWLTYERAVEYADERGTLVVASAGNNATRTGDELVHVPSDVPKVVSVSATGTSQLVKIEGQLEAAPGSDVLAFYSNNGPGVDVAAPGGDCGTQPSGESWCAEPAAARPAGWQTYLVLSSAISSSGTAGYAWMAGTSMSAPYVAGALALLRASAPSLPAHAARVRLEATAESLGDPESFGAGMLDVGALLHVPPPKPANKAHGGTSP